MSQSPYTKANILYTQTLRLLFRGYLFMFCNTIMCEFQHNKKFYFKESSMLIYKYIFNRKSCTQNKIK